jgi:hypothetical protein
MPEDGLTEICSIVEFNKIVVFDVKNIYLLLIYQREGNEFNKKWLHEQKELTNYLENYWPKNKIRKENN